MESLYWINSLPITQCMLVDSVSELATPQATPILSDIILHVLNQDIGANGSKINMSTTYNTPQEHLRSAIQLLGQRVGWGNLAPDLFERNAADLICNGTQSLLNDLLNDLRSIATGVRSSSQQRQQPTQQQPPPSTHSSHKKTGTNYSRKGDTKEQAIPSAPNTSPSIAFTAPSRSVSSSNRMSRTQNNRNQKQESKIHSTSNTRNVAASSSDGLASLSNDDLENARERVARMLMEAERSLAEDETKNERERSANRSTRKSTKAMKQRMKRSTRSVPTTQSSRQPLQTRASMATKTWEAPTNGWNQSTETLTIQQRNGNYIEGHQQQQPPQQNNHTTLARMSSQNVHLSTAQSIQRVSRDRGGKHRPAATSFHNREFSKGTTQQVDKNGLRMNGMWDPTFAPSLRRLSQLGFSPKKSSTRRTRSNENQGDSDQRGSYYYHDAVHAPSDVSGHPTSRGTSRDGGDSNDELEEDVEGASYVVRRRASTTGSGVAQWKKGLRTPSKKGKKHRSHPHSSQHNQSSLNGTSTADASNELLGSSRQSVFKGPIDASHALSDKQNKLLTWMIQLGVRPCPQKKRKELTGKR